MSSLPPPAPPAPTQRFPRRLTVRDDGSSVLVIPLERLTDDRPAQAEADGMYTGIRGQPRRRLGHSRVPLLSGLGTHYVFAHVGSPPQRVSLVVDTGSFTTAFPCVGCERCRRGGKRDFWDPDDSRTSAVVSCNDCRDPYTCSTRDEMCAFRQAYSEGSSWMAFQIHDVFRLGGQELETDNDLDDSSSIGLSWVHFGCIQSQSGMFDRQVADGIIGLSPHKASVLWQMDEFKALEQQQFSLCFSRQGGHMVMGGYDPTLIEPGEEHEYTHTIANEKWFEVQVEGVTLGGTPIASPSVLKDFARSPGTIIDSGTTDTYLPRNIAMEWSIAWKKATGEAFKNCEGLQYCMQFTREEFTKLPVLSVALADGVTLDVFPSEYMELGSKIDAPGGALYAPRVYMTESAGAVLGANAMMNRNVLFDFAGGRVGFAKARCDNGTVHPVKRPLGTTDDSEFDDDLFSNSSDDGTREDDDSHKDGDAHGSDDDARAGGHASVAPGGKEDNGENKMRAGEEDARPDGKQGLGPKETMPTGSVEKDSGAANLGDGEAVKGEISTKEEKESQGSTLSAGPLVDRDPVDATGGSNTDVDSNIDVDFQSGLAVELPDKSDKPMAPKSENDTKKRNRVDEKTVDILGQQSSQGDPAQRSGNSGGASLKGDPIAKSDAGIPYDPVGRYSREAVRDDQRHEEADGSVTGSQVGSQAPARDSTCSDWKATALRLDLQLVDRKPRQRSATVLRHLTARNRQHSLWLGPAAAPADFQSDTAVNGTGSDQPGSVAYTTYKEDMDCQFELLEASACKVECPPEVQAPLAVVGSQSFLTNVIVQARGKGRPCPEADEAGPVVEPCSALCMPQEGGRVEENDTQCLAPYRGFWGPCGEGCEQERFGGDGCRGGREVRPCRIGDHCASAKEGIYVDLPLTLDLQVNSFAPERSYDESDEEVRWWRHVGDALADAVFAVLSEVCSVIPGDIEVTVEHHTAKDPAPSRSANSGGGIGGGGVVAAHRRVDSPQGGVTAAGKKDGGSGVEMIGSTAALASVHILEPAVDKRGSARLDICIAAAARSTTASELSPVFARGLAARYEAVPTVGVLADRVRVAEAGRVSMRSAPKGLHRIDNHVGGITGGEEGKKTASFSNHNLGSSVGSSSTMTLAVQAAGIAALVGLFLGARRWRGGSIRGGGQGGSRRDRPGDGAGRPYAEDEEGSGYRRGGMGHYQLSHARVASGDKWRTS